MAKIEDMQQTDFIETEKSTEKDLSHAELADLYIKTKDQMQKERDFYEAKLQEQAEQMQNISKEINKVIEEKDTTISVLTKRNKAVAEQLNSLSIIIGG